MRINYKRKGTSLFLQEKDTGQTILNVRTERSHSKANTAQLVASEIGVVNQEKVDSFL